MAKYFWLETVYGLYQENNPSGVFVGISPGYIWLFVI